MSGHDAKAVRPEPPALTRLRGGPRGLLLHYILHSISMKPKHGYEILQDIDSKTEGYWKPGVGSVYPILKKLLANGYIKVEERSAADTRRVYSITEKGVQEVRNQSEMFANSSQRWMALRRLFLDMLDPAGLSSMFVEGSKKQFEMAKELLEARRDSLSRSELDFMLREYSLNLERQLEWTQSQLRALGSKEAAPRLER